MNIDWTSNGSRRNYFTIDLVMTANIKQPDIKVEQMIHKNIYVDAFSISKRIKLAVIFHEYRKLLDILPKRFDAFLVL